MHVYMWWQLRQGNKGLKATVDESYQNTFKLDPNNFITSFQIHSIPILQEIQTIDIVPTVVGLKADLCKLNIYMHVVAFVNLTF